MRREREGNKVRSHSRLESYKWEVGWNPVLISGHTVGWNPTNGKWVGILFSSQVTQ